MIDITVTDNRNIKQFECDHCGNLFTAEIAPIDGWKCFHCGEVFTDEDEARTHFGFATLFPPGCVDPLRGEEKAMAERATMYEKSWREALEERDAARAEVSTLRNALSKAAGTEMKDEKP